TVGPWTFASMFVARANHACGNIDRSLRTIRWLARTHGGRGGAWYEYIPITRENLAGNGLKPGIILWGWAEMAMFFTHQVLGVEPGRTGVTVAPRPFPAMGRVRASLPVRGRTLELELDAADPASGRARLDGGAWTPLGPKGVHLPYA